ncbi:MAG: LemA family protein [Gammaproteobacteria bacterium]|nr:LemA family protein [Gammaproteobacteria bacterium]
MASEFDKKERMRNSRERLRELYHDEVSPKFRVPRMVAAKTLLVVSLLTLLLFSATLLFKFNYFITIQEEVLAKRGHLEGAYQRRSNLFENLLKLTLNHAALEHEVFSHVADVRKDIIKKLELPPEIQQSIMSSLENTDGPSFGDFSKALAGLNASGMESSIGRLLGLVEQYPDIKSSETYKQMMEALMMIEDRIAERRMEYQDSIRMFNKEISQFPWYLLAKATGFKRFDYFYAERGAHIRPQIHADIFERLLPMVHLGGGATGDVKDLDKMMAPPAEEDLYKRLREVEAPGKLAPITEESKDRPGMRTLDTDSHGGVSEDPGQEPRP